MADGISRLTIKFLQELAIIAKQTKISLSLIEVSLLFMHNLVFFHTQEVFSQHTSVGGGVHPSVNANATDFSRHGFNTYDKNGKVISSIGYPLCSDTTKKKSRKSFYTYNNFGDLVEMKVYDAVGNLSMKIGYDYEYDKNGNWLKKTEHNYMPFPVKKDQHPGHYNWSYAITIREIEYY